MPRRKKRKRVVYRVTWKRVGMNRVLRWCVLRGSMHCCVWDTKAKAVRAGRGHAREERRLLRTLTQLVVHNKNGRIAFEHTYGADPRRSKG